MAVTDKKTKPLPKPYSQRRAKTNVLSGDKEQKSEIPKELKPQKAEPKPEPKIETKGGKQWDIIGDGRMYKIQFTSGGQIPAELSGWYTHLELAKQAIHAYEAKRG
jgi:hypothetical protein